MPRLTSGNYLFLDDGRIAVIDFGCVKEYTEAEMTPIMGALRANFLGDKDMVREAIIGLGMTPNEELFEKYFYPFTQTFAIPHQVEIFDFKQNPGFVDRYVKALTDVAKAGSVFKDFSSATVHIDRSFHGLYRIFDRLGAEIGFRHPCFPVREVSA